MEEEEKEEKKTTAPRFIKNLITKVFKACVYLFLTILGINAILFMLLSIPPVQNALTSFVIDQLKPMLKTEVSIGEIRLSLLDQVQLKDVYIEDQAKDTLLYASYLDVRLSPWEFIKNKQVAVTSVTLDKFLININQQDSISDYNFQFLIDAFTGDSVPKDTTSTSSVAVKIKDINIKRGKLNYDVYSDSITPNLFNASHISLSDFYANVDVKSIDMDKLDIAVNSLSVKEGSGLEITSLSGHLYSNYSLLYAENLVLELPNSHLKTNRAKFDLESQKFDVGTEDTEIDGRDLVAFLPELKFLNHKLSLVLDAEGQLPTVDLKRLVITYGSDALLNGQAYISDYDQFTEADIMVAINKFNITPKGIKDFARLGDSTFVAPDMLTNLGTVNLKASIIGRPSDFDFAAEARSRQGVILLSADGSVDSLYNMDIKSKLETTDFEVGKLLGENNELGKFTSHISINAQNTEKDGFSTQVRGVVDKLEIRDEPLENLYFVASYDAKEMGAKIYRDSKYGTIFARASMTQAKVPDISVELTLDDFEIGRFIPNERWIEPRLCMKLKGDIKGTDIDTMTGRVTLDSVHFHGDNFTFEPGLIDLKLTATPNNKQDITFTSSLATANIHGHYKFSTLFAEFSNIMHKCMPSVFDEDKSIKKNSNDFTYQFMIRNNEHYSKIFDIPVDIIKPIVFSGRVNTINEQLTLNTDIPQLKFGDIGINNSKLDLANQDSTFSISAKSSVLTAINNYNIGLKMDGGRDVIHNVLTLLSDSIDLGANGKLEAIANFNLNEEKQLVSSVEFIPSDIKFGKLDLNMLPGKIENVGEKTMVHNLGMNLNGERFFDFSGVISEDPEDILKVQFTQAQIGELLKGFEINDYAAILDGEIMLSNLFGDYPELNIYDFMIRDISIKSDTIGTLNIASNWGEHSRGLEFDALLQKDLRPVGNLKGQYTPRTDSLDVDVSLDRFVLDWIEPYTEGILTKLRGSISMDVNIKGNLNNPKTQGFFGFNETSIGIGMTNVVYTISDTIQITPERIGFKNLVLKDEKGNTARANASITHKDYKDVKMALDVNLNNLMVLNTMHQTDSLFYGRIYASGKVDIKSDKNRMDVVMQIKNDKNSKLNILLPQTSAASDYSSVVYINVPVDTTSTDSIQNYEERLRPPTYPIMLSVALDINQNLEMGVVIDPITGDKMDMKGNGNINFTYDIAKDIMNTYGRFVLVDGNVNFNLQNIKKLDFKIRPDSKLSFVGDPFKTSFDIVAYRRVRADLKTLDYSFETEGSSRVQVDCELGINGDMNKMDLTYDISLPTATDDQKRKVSTLINTDEERIKQFAYLIAAGSFHSSTGSSGANFGDGMWTSMASSTLSSGLNAALGNMLGDKWEVGTNLESSDGSLGSMDMSVSVSTRLLDDKLRLNTNIGYRTDNSASTDNSIIGDFEAEYDLTPTWMLKAYNHTNDQFYRQAPTTQGIGIAYTKDAATLKTLFKSIGRRRPRTPEEIEARKHRRDSILKVRDSLRLQTDTARLVSDSLQMKDIQLPADSIKSIDVKVTESDSLPLARKMPLRNEEGE